MPPALALAQEAEAVMTDVPTPQACLGLQMKQKSPKKLAVNITRNRATDKKICTTLSLGKTRLTNTGILVVLSNDRLV